MADGWPRPELEIGVELLSPLHVGSGRAPLLSDLDFAVQQGTVWVVDHWRLAELFSDEELRAGAPDIRLSRLLGPDRYPAFAAYSLTARGAVGNQIIPCVKDAEGRPYLPGSSLKGALRSALAWAAAGEQGHAPTGQELGRGSKYAALQWERRVFGATPHQDLLRALRVVDSRPVPPARLELAEIAVHSLQGGALRTKGPGFSFSVEALSPGTRLTCRLGADPFLLARPGWREKGSWLAGLAERCRARSAALIAREMRFYAECACHPLHQFYRRLQERAAALPEGRFLLQIGWGTGWQAKTIAERLAEAGILEDARVRYGLGRAGAPLPKSRRLVVRGGAPSEPLGWVEVEV